MSAKVTDKFHHERNTIGTNVERITNTSLQLIEGVVILASSANTGTVYIGDSDVTAGGATATDGMRLDAGDVIVIPISDPSLLYAVASASNQNIYIFAI